MLLALLGGCGRPGELRGLDGEPPVDAPAVDSLLAAHNDGLSRLTMLHASGVVELDWKDEDGAHHDQGDIELWLRSPNQTAIRVHKSAIGEEFLWLGTDGSQFWVFDRRKADEVDASVGSIDDELTVAGRGSSVFRPRAFLDLCGLSTLTAKPEESAVYDATRDAWQALVRGQSGDLRVSFDQRSRRLVGVELLDDAGNLVAASSMKPERYASAPIDNAPLGAFPSLPTLVNIRSADSEDRVLVSLDQDSLDGRASQNFPDRVFDLDLLMRRFKPIRVNGELVATTP
jgi:hypothetical protein